MAKRIITKIGDVFIVEFGCTKKYFQYISNDMAMMNSSVIRVFKKEFSKNDHPSLLDIVSNEVDFYAHTVLRWGINQDAWKKIGNVPIVNQLENIYFRSSLDYGIRAGEKRVEVSAKWNIWKLGDTDYHFVNKLEGVFRKADIGEILPAFVIIDRMKNGRYTFPYPNFE